MGLISMSSMPYMETISTRIPPALAEEIEDLIEKGYYGSKSDFLKDAIRFRLWYLREKIRE